jgi:hypothetical protein
LLTRSRAILISLAALLLVGAALAGYAVGSGGAADTSEAEAAREEAQEDAFADARKQAMRAAREEGVKAGRRAGREQAREEGGRRGRIAGERAAQAELDAIALATASAEPEAEGDERPLGTAGVLVVGDSLEVLTSPYLEQYLQGLELTINVVGGYSSPQIFELFQEAYDPSQSVIVFDAGTNDNPQYPEILAGNLQSVAEIVGSRCMVVPTIHGYSVNGYDSTGKNQVVAAFAARRPGTQTPDWAGAVRDHPEMMQPDNLHPTPAGANFRAQLIAEGVRNCLIDPDGF